MPKCYISIRSALLIVLILSLPLSCSTKAQRPLPTLLPGSSLNLATYKNIHFSKWPQNIKELYKQHENEYANNFLQNNTSRIRSIQNQLNNYDIKPTYSSPYYTLNYQYSLEKESLSGEDVLVRSKIIGDRTPTKLFTLNQLSEALGNSILLQFKISPDDQLLALKALNAHSNLYIISVWSFDLNKFIFIEQIDTHNFEWGHDSNSLFYTQLNNLRSDSLWQINPHIPSIKNKIYQSIKADEFITIKKSFDSNYLLIRCDFASETIWQFLNLYYQNAKLEKLQTCALPIYCKAQVNNQSLLLISNSSNKQVSIIYKKINPLDKKIGINTDPFEYYEDITFIGDNPAILVRKDFNYYLKIYQCNNIECNLKSKISFPKEVFQVSFSSSDNSNSPYLTINSSGLIYPNSKFVVDKKTGLLTLIHQDKLDPSIKIITEEYSITHKEFEDTWGTKIPVTLFYRNDLIAEKTAVIIDAYGAYGTNISLAFSPFNLRLVNQGYVIAFAHIRGGSEKGISWYNNGRGLLKQNSFNDLSLVVKEISKLYTNKKIIGFGRSAGALSIANIAYNNPQIFDGLILEAPFISVVETLQNSKHSLTQKESSEWGDISKENELSYINSYDPFQLAQVKDFPPTIIISGKADNVIPADTIYDWLSQQRITNFTKQKKPMLYYFLLSEMSHEGGLYSHNDKLIQALKELFIENIAENT